MKKTNEKGKLLNLFRTKKFIEDNYEADKQLIIDKYNELGYRDAIIDVYKRQSLSWAIYSLNSSPTVLAFRAGITASIKDAGEYSRFSAENSSTHSAYSVSYTHLDVYKRQT